MQFSTIIGAFMSASVALASPTPTVEERGAACGTGISPARSQEVVRAFSSAGVTPTLIPSISPKSDLKITYPSANINLGTQTTSLQTVQAPAFQFTTPVGDSASQTYSLFLVDPDVPGPNGPPVVGSPRINFLHWYVSGIKQCGISGNTVTIYEPPTPVSPGEQHRYTWLVYREPAGYSPNLLQAQARPGFDLLGYTSRGKLGQPIAGNFMNQSITNT
ncbi:uncharacterized protein MYCFIDRAFT_84293 [Pseudocercospora fijiensis CIRAD86]|uniref:Phosphatidylethanolamine-binding protein n=1 Tax=Pseudocercospora fijiensis (strain CIRAD86) TaxID=383855 RepID=M3AKH7_PSEFD|nr:uncharacterized protein MYCFIDRAFT_84293 [Pseudocercospora fijiensis CIRAD86]EME77663.1 hypothetical protein MYCFIDRAFT_84293 [Pseudocercospora fijiensis CIRAD86]